MKKLFRNLMLAILLIAASTTAYAQEPTNWITTGNTSTNGSSKLGHMGSYPLNFVTGGVTRMTIKQNNGRVGIGTTAPINKLDVYTQTPEDGIRVIQKGTGGLGGYGGAAALHLDNATTGGFDWTLYSMGSGNTNEGTGNFVIYQSPSGVFPAVTNTPRLIIEGLSGNVGIGTLTAGVPNAVLSNKLEVAVTNPEDGILVTQRGGASGNGAAGLHLKNNTAGGKMWSLYSLGSGNTTEGSGNFLIQEADAYMVNQVTRLIIQKGSGNVGIGTIAPSEKLEVNSGVGGKSGLKFTNLTAASATTATPGDFDCTKFLTVDNNGEVILVKEGGCGASSKSAGSDIDLSAQQAQVDALQSQVEELKKEIAEMKAMFSSAPVKSTKMTSSINNVHLSQIAPNPFSQNATISFSLPEDVTDAQLLITDLSGKVLKSYSLHAGATQQVINGNELIAGSYLYSISVNGKVIDSKQMVVTH